MSWKCSECGFENTDDSMNTCVCGAEYLTPTEKKYNPKLMYAATFLVAVAAALMFWTWDWRFLLVALPASFWAHSNRPTSKSEREKLEDFSNKTFAYSLMFPVGIIFIALIVIAAFAIFKKNF